MKKLVYLFNVLLLATVLGGCFPRIPAQSTPTATNPNVKVELLFEVDGCKVYRFFDGGGVRYFTKCNNSASSSVGWLESCGKNCTYYAQNTTSYPKIGQP